MTKTLQELRKEAGYKSAKDFAEAIGMSESSYSRYEADSSNINMKAALKLADFLHCSLDMIMGRDPVHVEDMRGDFQKFYDSLSDDNRKLLDEFCEFLKQKEEAAAEQQKKHEARKFFHLALQYERQFMEEQANSAEKDELFSIGTSDAIMLSFFKYVFEIIDSQEESKAVDDMNKIYESVMQKCRRNFNAHKGISNEPTPEEHKAWVHQAQSAVASKRPEIEKEANERRDYKVAQILKAYKSLHPQEEDAYEYYVTEFK